MAYQQQPGYDQQQGYGQQQYQQPYHEQQPYAQQPNYAGGQAGYQQPPPPGQAGYQQPPPGQSQAAVHPPAQTDVGSFQGGSYSITHRDTNSVLNIDLQSGGSVRSKSGAMVHMAGTIQLAGKIKFSMKKFFTGGEMSESTYTGTGKVALAPNLFGDIITLHVDGQREWTIGKDAFLACTSEVKKDTKAQGIGKALFSGEDLFIYKVAGQGLMWLTSFGAVDRLDLQPGEQHIVDNGHLVAWSCNYTIEKAGGGAMSSMKTGEGLVCRFTGPGTVYIQTRNMAEFEAFIRALAGGNN